MRPPPGTYPRTFWIAPLMPPSIEPAPSQARRGGRQSIEAGTTLARQPGDRSRRGLRLDHETIMRSHAHGSTVRRATGRGRSPAHVNEVLADMIVCVSRIDSRSDIATPLVPQSSERTVDSRPAPVQAPTTIS